MKIYRSLLAILLSVAIMNYFVSCGKLAQSLSKTFTISTSAFPFTIPHISDTVAVASNIIMPTVSGSFTYNLDSSIKANTGGLLGINNITSFKIMGCLLTVNNPDILSNFQAFKTLSLAFTSVSNSTPFQLSVNQSGIPNTTILSSMNLLPSDTVSNLQSYLQGSNFSYQLSGQLNRGTGDSMKCNAVFTFSVRVQG